jgi:hypothetical protein
MGKHYVPQQHLRRFHIQGKPEIVWQYDKKTGSWSDAAVSKIANERDFYPQDVEDGLKEIEKEGNIAIDMLRGGQQLPRLERSQFAFYLLTMYTRGPRHRKKASNLMAAALKKTADDVLADIEEFRLRPGTDSQTAESYLQELAEVESKFAKQRPPQIQKLIDTPFWSARTAELVLNMHWHIFPAPPGMFFVTCDTPVHLFDCYGVGTPKSELTFTISKDLALIGEHQKSWGTTFEKPHAQFAKEINRRILSLAERFVYSPKKASWIEIVAQKMEPFLSRIVWSQ